MVIVVLSGGLGNQMFQYAFYLALKKNCPEACLNAYSVIRENTHNGFELERLFGISAHDQWKSRLLVRIIRKLLIFKKRKYFKTFCTISLKLISWLGINVVVEKGFSTYNNDYLQNWKSPTLLFGFWQTELYFNQFRNEVLSSFRFNLSILSNQTLQVQKVIQEKESVSIHIRRGDYILPVYQTALGNICTLDYYKSAISKIQKEVNNPYFVIFSDDICWVKENIQLENAIYVDWNKKENSWQDMYLMSKCKHNIIANSTFSWWGAWLNEHDGKKVIAPSRFMNTDATPDIIPEQWIVI